MRRTLIVCLLIAFVLNSFGVDVVPPTSLTITGYEGPIEEGSTLQLQAIPTPSNTTYTEYIWSSDETSVATIDDNGLVTAVSEGTATIECLLTIAGPRFFAIPDEQTATCTIVVKKKTPIVETIAFADPEVKRICVANWDTDGDGELSYDEAAAVTAIGTVFKGNSVITAFNELAYFTGLISIAGGAFRSDVNLKSIVIPDGLRFIESEAFRDCRSLESITIPESVVKIGGFAFCDCFSIPSLYIPKNVSSIGSGVTSADGKAFASIVVDSDNPYYDSRDNCNAILETATNTLIADGKNTVIPSSVTSLGDWVFYDRPDTEIVIPQQITSIGQGAFGGCSNLERLTLPSSITSISNEAFRYARKLNEVRVYMKSPVAITDRVFFEVELGNVTLYVPNGSKAAYQAADNWKNFKEIIEMDIAGSDAIEFADAEVKRICVENWDTDGDGELSYDEAAAVTDLQRRFSSNKAITQFNELRYFKGLTILYNEFSHCEALQSVVIPENVVTVGALAFSVCENLTHVELPEGLDMLGDFAFISCEKLPKITIPKSVRTICNWTFQNCNSLTSIEIPENVNHMGNNIISACEKLTTVTVNAKNKSFDSRDNCNAIIDTNTNTLIAACKTTIIPNSVKALGDHAFNFCCGLTNIEIPYSVESIGYGAFNGDSITSIRISANVSFVGLRVFGYCDKLSSIEVDDNNPIYDSRNNCNAIIETATNTLIAGSVNTIIPDDVTSIADYAFFGYYSLKNIVLPSNIASIGTDAFGGINFSTVTAKMETPAVIASEGTLYGRKQATLYVPKGCKAVYEAAEYWKDFKEIVEIEDENPNVEVTDIAQMDNAIYIEPFTAFIGNDVNVEICLKNSQTATAYVFNMILPEGVTVATNSNGEYIDELSCRHDDHMRMFNYLDENTYTLLSLSTNSEKLKDNESAIRLLTLHVSDELAEGVYAIEIKNASYSKPDGTLVRLQDTTSSITLGDFVCGDVNSDGKVDVSDYIGVANHIMGNTPEGFVMKAADVDESGTIDVSDYIGIANLIMTGNVFGNNNQSRISRKGEIE